MKVYLVHASDDWQSCVDAQAVLTDEDEANALAERFNKSGAWGGACVETLEVGDCEGLLERIEKAEAFHEKWLRERAREGKELSEQQAEWLAKR